MICDKCKEEIKETMITVLGQKIKRCEPCKCQRDKKEEENKKFAIMKEQEKINRRRTLCFGAYNPRYKTATWYTDDKRNPSHSKNLKRFTPDNKKLKTGLLLYGDTGTSKTFYASCIANDWIDKGKTAFFTTIAEVAQASFEEKDTLMQHIKKADLLIFDDLGIERDTEFMNEQVYNMINARYLTGKTTIFTTNLTLKQICYPEKIADKRVFSRVLEMTFPYELKGEDGRRKQAKYNHERGMKMLEGV